MLDLTRVNGPGDLLWNRRDGGSTLRREFLDKEEVRATPR